MTFFGRPSHVEWLLMANIPLVSATSTTYSRFICQGVNPCRRQGLDNGIPLLIVKMHWRPYLAGQIVHLEKLPDFFRTHTRLEDLREVEGYNEIVLLFWADSYEVTSHLAFSLVAFFIFTRVAGLNVAVFGWNQFHVVFPFPFGLVLDEIARRWDENHEFIHGQSQAL